MRPRHPFADTYEQILREKLPNLFRLYLNPYVAQTCFCLGRYAQSSWDTRTAAAGDYQSFLANIFDEALSGAIKLARYRASLAGRPTTGLVIDVAERLGSFASATLADGARVEFLPGLLVARCGEDVLAVERARERFGLVVLVATADDKLGRCAEATRRLVAGNAPLVITCVDRATLAALRRAPSGLIAELRPDIVVFDESFTNHGVPFGAFTAPTEVFKPWNRRGKATFHSTTYQPNTVSNLHFMRCLEKADPDFVAAHAPELEKILSDVRVRGDVFRRLYSPSLYRAISATGFDVKDPRADGDFILGSGRKIFDAVGGVACSVRGHNPSSYASQMEDLAEHQEAEAEVSERLRNMTNLEFMLPAVSGATAVETALKVALVAQFPRRHVLALKAGFGGKTLLALTGTANSSYKEHVHPLYGDVLYIDPFAPDAIARVEDVLTQHPVAVIQVEPIQAVGGVRRVPEEVIRYLGAQRETHGYLLLVDEVQTGMYRTGPFTLSGAMGLSPDLLVLGKGTSDMMFPFGLVLYSAGVQAKLDRARSDLPAEVRRRYKYDFGYKTVLNVLRLAEELRLAERVAAAGALFARLLGEGLASCRAVREVRVHGLLIGIELHTSRWPGRWIRKRLVWFYLLAMLRHPRYPVLVGFCQYEPNVLKITPPLTVAPAEIRNVCATITEVLRRPLHRLLATGLGGLMKPRSFRRPRHEHDSALAGGPAAR
jgi:acetylornithine/succinyldiaminopimelate/putrescine aminotransferase